ncbi:MAG: hypothetical protein IIA19_03450 [Thaumarchaeota archaeon]|nr:hypothetical protein [Nitrososphaerota archaeon]
MASAETVGMWHIMRISVCTFFGMFHEVDWLEVLSVFPTTLCKMQK